MLLSPLGRSGNRHLDFQGIWQAIRGQCFCGPGGVVRIDPENQHTWKVFRLGKIVEGGQFEVLASSEEPIRPESEAARIKPAVVHVESHPYLPQWELLDYCRTNGIVLQAFAALGHSSEPKLLEDPVVTAIAKRVNKTPAQVVLAWAIQRGTALLTTSKTPSRIKENFEVYTLPEDAMQEITEGIKTRVRFNAVVETGVPGFIPRRSGG
jgi:hypothetical protein